MTDTNEAIKTAISSTSDASSSSSPPPADAAGSESLQKSDAELAHEPAGELQSKIDQLMSEIDVERMLDDVHEAMRPLQDKIATMSSAIGTKMDEMGRRLGELEARIVEIIDECAQAEQLGSSSSAVAAATNRPEIRDSDDVCVRAAAMSVGQTQQ